MAGWSCLEKYSLGGPEWQKAVKHHPEYPFHDPQYSKLLPNPNEYTARTFLINKYNKRYLSSESFVRFNKVLVEVKYNGVLVAGFVWKQEGWEKMS